MMIKNLEYFDKQLLESYYKYTELLSDKPLDFQRQRFSLFALSAAQWQLIELAEIELLQQNFENVHAALSRFQHCSYANNNHFDEKGINQHCGYDYCILSEPAIYSSLLGQRYIKTAFPITRKMSKGAYPAYMYAANIILALEHPEWPYTSTSIDKARSFIATKNAKKFEVFYIQFFLNIFDKNVETAANSLIEFNQHYAKSDWGKNKPFARLTFMQALARFSGFYLDNTIILNKLAESFPASHLEFWNQFYKEKDRFTDYQYSEPLAFLNIIV